MQGPRQPVWNFISYLAQTKAIMHKLDVISVLSTVDEMLEYWHLIEYLGYPANIEEYKTLLTEMVKRGYTQIVYEEEGEAMGLAGFWVNTKLFSGKYIDVDNVIVNPSKRSKGIGSVLMNWIEKHAKDIDAKMIVLDAFVGSTQAHKFYFKENYIVKGFHFAKDI